MNLTQCAQDSSINQFILWKLYYIDLLQALSRLCVIQGELILREEVGVLNEYIVLVWNKNSYTVSIEQFICCRLQARAISEITIKMALEEERREIRVHTNAAAIVHFVHNF